jgi:hypothetical protein
LIVLWSTTLLSVYTMAYYGTIKCYRFGMFAMACYGKNLNLLMERGLT